jgi:hypothetical protein
MTASSQSNDRRNVSSSRGSGFEHPWSGGLRYHLECTTKSSLGQTQYTGNPARPKIRITPFRVNPLPSAMIGTRAALEMTLAEGFGKAIILANVCNPFWPEWIDGGTFAKSSGTLGRPQYGR